MSIFPQGPLVIAHRGASAHLPENTLSAFAAAERAGADAIELDVRLTADGVPVVLHDADAGAAIGGSGVVSELTLAEVKRLDASRGASTREEIPTLAEVLSTVGIGLDLEIKNIPGEAAFDSPDERVLQATLDELERSRFAPPVLISSFNWLTIERCREVRPDLATGFLTVAAIDARAALQYVRHAGHTFVLPQAPAVLDAGAAFVDQAQSAGIRVGTWTVDDPETASTLFGWGVDAIATNDPAALVPIRDSSGEQR